MLKTLTLIAIFAVYLWIKNWSDRVMYGEDPHKNFDKRIKNNRE